MPASPYDAAGVNAVALKSDQRELVGNGLAGSNVQRGSGIRQVTKNTANRGVAKADERQIQHFLAFVPAGLGRLARQHVSRWLVSDFTTVLARE